MRDHRIAPRGWPNAESNRRSIKVGHWHDDWARRWRDRAEFRPETRTVENSDYNQHYVDVEAPVEAELDYSARSDEVSGSFPGGTRRLPIPTGAERLRGAMVGAGIGDGFAYARDHFGLTSFPWDAGAPIRAQEKFVDFLPASFMPSTWITQLMGYSAEGLIRALAGRRIGQPVDPVSTVQHALQRWLYYMKRSVSAVGEWRIYGGIYARDVSDHDYPDGLAGHDTNFVSNRDPDAAVLDALLGFASTGTISTPADPRSEARGADVLVRAALAAVWSEDLSETFDLAVAIAALTHPHPDDYLPAAALAVILHQQLRDHPFMDCLAAGYSQASKRSGHEKTLAAIDTVVSLVRDEWVPTQPSSLRRHFPNGGADGVEALGIALYSAMVSDYIREALLLALNYATHRPQVAAVAGMLIGAEYGIQAVPKALREPVASVGTLDAFAQDLATELRDVLTDAEWLRRYPPT